MATRAQKPLFCIPLETPHLHVQVVVEVLVDLLAVAVLLEQTTQHTGAADPEDLGWQTSLTGTTALTYRSGMHEVQAQTGPNNKDCF
jgi:hypothetical protein